MRPKLLDLFCCAGGSSVGYHRAGFDVFGVDIDFYEHFPYEMAVSDAVVFMERFLDGRAQWGLRLSDFAAIHASPPCQAFSNATARNQSEDHRLKHLDLITPTRPLLEQSGLPFVIENVPAARSHLVDPVQLCGSSFGLDIRRHRLFETNWDFVGLACDHAWQTPRFRNRDNRSRTGLQSVVTVAGHLNYPGEKELREKAMGINWMSTHELAEALPPAYTEYVGKQLLGVIE